jgi:hypothetical protein
MSMTAGRLFDAIRPVCPIVGAAVGDALTRGTWTYEAAAGATQAQLDAANNVIATIPIVGEGVAGPNDFINAFADAEYVALGKKRMDDFTAGQVGLAKMWDVVVRQDIINMNKQETKDLKAALVSSGILTQARADQIFSTPSGAMASSWRF